jgi:hypothetical protein
LRKKLFRHLAVGSGRGRIDLDLFCCHPSFSFQSQNLIPIEMFQLPIFTQLLPQMSIKVNPSTHRSARAASWLRN